MTGSTRFVNEFIRLQGHIAIFQAKFCGWDPVRCAMPGVSVFFAGGAGRGSSWAWAPPGFRLPASGLIVLGSAAPRILGMIRMRAFPGAGSETGPDPLQPNGERYAHRNSGGRIRRPGIETAGVGGVLYAWIVSGAGR